ARVAGEGDLPPRPRWPQNLLGPHGAAVRKLHGLATLEPPERRAPRDAEAVRLVEVEAAGPCTLAQHVAVRREAVLDCKGLDPIVGALDSISRGELDQGQVVAPPPEHAPQNPEELVEPRRAVDGERHLAATEGEGLQH